MTVNPGTFKLDVVAALLWGRANLKKELRAPNLWRWAARAKARIMRTEIIERK